MSDRCPTCDREECPSWTNRRGFRCPVACDVYMCVHVAPLAQNAYDNCSAHAHDWRAEALALRAEVAALKTRPLTVGAALALPEVQSGACVVEYSGKHDGAIARQTRVDRYTIESRWFNDDTGWTRWRTTPDSPVNNVLDGCDIAKPCRLVQFAIADANPATRGEMP